MVAAIVVVSFLLGAAMPGGSGPVAPGDPGNESSNDGADGAAVGPTDDESDGERGADETGGRMSSSGDDGNGNDIGAGDDRVDADDDPTADDESAAGTESVDASNTGRAGAATDSDEDSTEESSIPATTRSDGDAGRIAMPASSDQDVENGIATATPKDGSTPSDREGEKTKTPTPTETETPTETPTDTPTETQTPTDTPTGGQTPTETPTETPTGTPTDTPTETPTDTPTDTPTETGTTTQTPDDRVAISFILLCSTDEDAPTDVQEEGSEDCPDGGEPFVRWEWNGNQFVAEDEPHNTTMEATEFKDDEQNEPVEAEWTSGTYNVSGAVVGAGGDTCTYPGDSGPLPQNGTVESCSAGNGGGGGNQGNNGGNSGNQGGGPSSGMTNGIVPLLGLLATSALLRRRW